MTEDKTTFENKVRQSLGFIWRAKRLYEKICQEAGDKLGLTQNEIDVLLFLANNPAYDTAMDIVNYRHISKSLVSKSVAFLMSRGLLEAAKNSGDRRNTHLRITQEAESAVHELQAAQRRYFDLLERAAGDDFEVFVDMMCRISAGLDIEIKARQNMDR